MAEENAEPSSVTSADIHVYIFPDLDDFLVIDVRNLDAPKVQVRAVKELLTEEYLRGLERAFSKLLRSDGPPFTNLMLLPARLQALWQQQGIANLLRLFGANESSDPPRISLFLCSGPILAMSDEALSLSMEPFFEGRVASGFVAESHAALFRLLQDERTHIAQKERDELRRAVVGKSEQFFTLWQQSPGGFSSS